MQGSAAVVETVAVVVIVVLRGRLIAGNNTINDLALTISQSTTAGLTRITANKTMAYSAMTALYSAAGPIAPVAFDNTPGNRGVGNLATNTSSAWTSIGSITAGYGKTPENTTCVFIACKSYHRLRVITLNNRIFHNIPIIRIGAGHQKNLAVRIKVNILLIAPGGNLQNCHVNVSVSNDIYSSLDGFLWAVVPVVFCSESVIQIITRITVHIIAYGLIRVLYVYILIASIGVRITTIVGNSQHHRISTRCVIYMRNHAVEVAVRWITGGLHVITFKSTSVVIKVPFVLNYFRLSAIGATPIEYYSHIHPRI